MRASLDMHAHKRSTSRGFLRAAARKFQLLKSFPNVLISPHSAFLTAEALANIAATTVQNLKVTLRSSPLLTGCPVTAEHVVCMYAFSVMPKPGVQLSIPIRGVRVLIVFAFASHYMVSRVACCRRLRRARPRPTS